MAVEEHSSGKFARLPDLRASLLRALGLERFNLLDQLSIGADQFPGLTPQVRNFCFEFLTFGSTATLVLALGLQLMQQLLLIRHLLLQCPDLPLSFRDLPPCVFHLLLGHPRLDGSLALSCAHHGCTTFLDRCLEKNKHRTHIRVKLCFDLLPLPSSLLNRPRGRCRSRCEWSEAASPRQQWRPAIESKRLGVSPAASMNQMFRPPQADQRPVLETLAGSVERVTFHNAENGFAVLKVHARGKRDLVTVVGHTPAVGAGEWITASGIWISDRTHGLQFKAEVLKTTPPTGAEGIEKYLASGQMRGIGPAMAKRIVAAFGVDTFEIIEAAPERLTDVPGIGPMRASRIVSGWAEQKAVREIMIFLHAHGVGTARAVRIFKTYGYEAIQVMTEDPYRLAKDVRGIGFKTADAIAAKLGMEKTAPQRIRAGISFALQTATDEGHCALPVEALTRLAEQLLEVDQDLIRTAVVEELSKGEIISDTIDDETCLFLKGLYLSEQAIASRLLERASGPLPWPEIDLDKAIPWVESRTGKTLAASQREALKLVLGSKISVVTGGPGVGKTTLLDTILRLLVAKGVKVALAAPTGRAAKRMTEQTGLEAKTIHRLLEIDPKHGGFSRNEENPLDCDLLVVDETSMVDVPLMNALTKDHSAACRSAAGGRRGSVAFGGIRAGAGRHHRLGAHPGRAADGGVPAGGGEPDRRQCPPDQQGPDARAAKGWRGDRFLFRRDQRS